VLFTDMQIWDSRWGTPDDAQTVREAFEAYRDSVAPDASLYMIDLATSGDLVTPEGNEGVYNVSGWSENALAFIGHVEEPLQILDTIEAFEPP
jgi:hypothetical protein